VTIKKSHRIDVASSDEFSYELWRHLTRKRNGIFKRMYSRRSRGRLFSLSFTFATPGIVPVKTSRRFS